MRKDYIHSDNLNLRKEEMKSLKAVLILFFAVVTGVVVASFAGCGGSGSSSSTGSTTQSYFGTASPGDAWQSSITKNSSGNGTFTASNQTMGVTYNGTVSTLPNKFLKLTFTSSTDANVVGKSAYAIEFPGTALIVKPAMANASAVVASVLGKCPCASAKYNWVKIPGSRCNADSDEAFGVANSIVSGNGFTFDVMSNFLNGTMMGGMQTISGYTCSGGRITTSSMPKVMMPGPGPSMSLAVTPSGVFVGDNGHSGGLVGMSVPGAAIGNAPLLAKGLEFRGVLFKNQSPGDKTEPVWARTYGNGMINGGGYINFENNVEDMVNGVTLSLNNDTATPGMFSGILHDKGSNTSYPFTLMINKINGKYMIFGISKDNSNGPYNFLVIQQ